MTIEEMIRDIHGNVEVLMSDNKAIKKTVYGNGQKGLSDRTTILEQAIIALLKEQTECPAREEYTNKARRERTSLLVAAAAVIIAVVAIFV